MSSFFITFSFTIPDKAFWSEEVLENRNSCANTSWAPSCASESSSVKWGQLQQYPWCGGLNDFMCVETVSRA